MKFVLTNDDGYGEPGLAALSRAVETMGEFIVAAPREPHSFVGHRVTLREPIRVEPDGENRYIVHGAPADCARLALKQFAPGADWLISGINPGANLGTDVYQSGTVAAAREAAILGVKAIAVSQYIAPGWTIDWDVTAHHVASTLKALMGEILAPGQYWNVNMPAPLDAATLPAHEFCQLDKNPHQYDFSLKGDAYHYQGIIHNRPRTAGRDVDVCFGGKVSITKLEV